MGSVPILGSLLVLLFMLGVALALVVFGLAWLGRRRAVRRASCGSCGYAVAGLEKMRCPECGADLREVGIVTPDQSGVVPPVTLAVLLGLVWTMLLPFPALVVTKLIVDSRPRASTVSAIFSLKSARGGFRPVVIELTGEGPNATIPVYSRAELREVGESGGPDRIVQFAVPEMRLVDGDGATVDAAFVADWLGPPAKDRTDADLAAAADELIKHIRAGAQRGGIIMINSPAIYTNANVTSGVQPAPLSGWLIPALIAPWIAIWLIGVLLIVRRRRWMSRMPKRQVA